MTEVSIVTAEDDEPRHPNLPTRYTSQEMSAWTPRMVISMDDAVAMINERVQFMERVLSTVKDGVYTVPGSDKQALGKAGAERLLSAYGLHPQTYDESPPVLDFTGEEHGGEPLLMFRRGCRIWRQVGPGEHDRMLVAEAAGLCHSRETKYRYRNAALTCPECGKDGIRFVANATYITGGKGWYHAKKAGGCGAAIPEGDPRATKLANTDTGKVVNPEVADQLNTILKMADKRALVAATIMAVGWSDILTQDMDETDGAADTPPAIEHRAPTQRATRGNANERTPRNVTVDATAPNPLWAQTMQFVDALDWDRDHDAVEDAFRTVLGMEIPNTKGAWTVTLRNLTPEKGKELHTALAAIATSAPTPDVDGDPFNPPATEPEAPPAPDEGAPALTPDAEPAFPLGDR